MSAGAPPVASSAPVAGAASAPAAPPALSSGPAALYVGDLAPDVNEQDLLDLFSQFGPLRPPGVRLNVDIVTRRSRGYAYVNFEKREDADTAMDALNFTELKGKPIRIMWSQRDPQLRRSGVGNVFIKNLHPEIDSRDLYDTFSQIGNILSCKVATDVSGASRGYGFVHFDTKEAAKAAVEQINGMMLKDQKVFVGPFIPHNTRAKISETNFTNVYLKNLADDVTTEVVKEEFGRFGVVKSAIVMVDEAGKSRHFGFVDFERSEDAQRVVGTMNGVEFRGQILYAARAQRKSERVAELRRHFEEQKTKRRQESMGKNMYVKNLDESIDDAKLKEFFQECGTITSAKVMMDPETKTSRGFGFVCFSTQQEAEKAKMLDGRLLANKPVRVRQAMPKEARRAQLESLQAGTAVPGAFPAPYAAILQQRMGGAPPGAQPGYVPWGRPPPPYAMYPQQMMGAPPAGYPVAVQMPMRYPGGVMAPPGSQMGAAGRPRQGRRGGAGMQYASSGPRMPPRQQYRGMPPGGQVPPVMAAGGRGYPMTDAFAGGYPPPAEMNPELVAKSDEERKRILGEALFSQVSSVNLAKPEKTPKITGMLLALGDAEADKMLREQKYLRERVGEALAELERLDVMSQAVLPSGEAPTEPGVPPS